MDVITIESKAYHELMGKIEKILRYIEKEEKAKAEYENRLVTNDELAEILGISKRTLQRMRSADRINYKMMNISARLLAASHSPRKILMEL